MPNCVDCQHFVQDYGVMGPQCMLGILPLTGATHKQHKARVKACDCAILLKHLPQMSGKVLEVGPGVSRWIKRFVSQRATWYGIDPVWGHNPAQNCFKGSVGDLPFEAESFDWVVSFSSVEHWNEHGTLVVDGLQQIYRVLRPGGRMLIAAPYHNHGHDLFYFGQRNFVENIFKISAPWSTLVFEEWARERSPLPTLQEWRIETHRIPALLEATHGVEPFTSTLEIYGVK